MKENCKHTLLGILIENLRKVNKITIQDLSTEAHISTKTYARIKKGTMPD